MSHENKTEKATEQRRKKAREAESPATLGLWRRLFSSALDQAVRNDLSLATPLFSWSWRLLDRLWKPLALLKNASFDWIVPAAAVSVVFVMLVPMPSQGRGHLARRNSRADSGALHWSSECLTPIILRGLL